MVWMKSVVPASCGLRFFVVKEIALALRYYDNTPE